MNLLVRFPIRLTIPALLFLLALVAAVCMWKYSESMAMAMEEKKAFALVIQDMTQLQASLAEALRKGDRQSVQSAIAIRGSDRNVVVVALIDDAGVVIGSTDRMLIGTSADQTLPGVDAAAWRKVKETLSGAVSLSDDRQAISAYYPVTLGATAGEVRPHRVGTIYLRYDLSLSKEMLNHLLKRQGIILAAFFIACFLILSVLLHLVLTERMNQLVAAVKRFATGDFSARTGGLEGEDEIGRIGEVFDAMADSIAKSQEELRSAALRYRIVADNTYDWEFWQSPTGEFIYISPSCEAITGFKDEEFLANPGLMESIIHPDDRSRFAEHRQRAFSPAPTDMCEYRIIRADGTIRWIEHICQPVFSEKGDFLGRRGSNRDATDRKLAEEKLHKLYLELEERVAERTAQLEATNKELESIMYTASHVLRAPLRAINGFSYILLAEHNDQISENVKHHLGSVVRNSAHMGRFIDDILAFVEISRRRIDMEVVNMSTLVRDVFAQLHAMEPERKININIGELPPALADPRMIRKALANLLGNAIKFTRRCKDPAIEVGGAVEGMENVYWVRDNGAGFDMRYAGKLFGVFQRLHSDDEFEGTGIGLAMFKRIIERHGGRVWAEGKVGEGVIVHFSLPITKNTSRAHRDAPDNAKPQNG